MLKSSTPWMPIILGPLAVTLMLTACGDNDDTDTSSKTVACSDDLALIPDTASFECTADHFVIHSSGLPNHPWERVTPDTPQAQDYIFEIPRAPAIAPESTELPAWGPIGLAINGIPILTATNELGQNVVEGPDAEIFDACNGHADERGRYHYNQLSTCIWGSDDSAQMYPEGAHSPLFGYAWDGFPIYGPHGEDGVALTTDDLDPCHGHDDDTRGYHYHATADFPYLLGCYRGTPETSNLDSSPF